MKLTVEIEVHDEERDVKQTQEINVRGIEGIQPAELRRWVYENIVPAISNVIAKASRR